MKKRIMLTCKDPGQFFRNCRACKHYEKCDYSNKIKKKKKKETHQNLQTDCNHDYEFKISQYKNGKWWNYYKCRKCRKGLKVYNSNLRHDRRAP